MRTFVLDTSVAVAWYLPEVFSDAAREWQQRLLDGKISLVVPLLHYWEIANVLHTYVRRRELKGSFAAEIYDLHLEAPFEIAEPDTSIILQTSLKYEATAYDAVYIALSVSRDIPLITAEKTTTPWVTKMAQRIRSVR